MTLLALLVASSAAHAADRVYWAGFQKLDTASLDGSGAIEALSTGTTAVNQIEGMAIDPVTNRIYWVDRVGNNSGRKILYANLDGTGGGELNIAGASNVESRGLAIDPIGRKIYWADPAAGKIGFARLDGFGGGTLAFAKLATPGGVAVDPVARRIYWVNEGGLAGNKAAFANLDGPGEESLPIGTAESRGPYGAAIDPVHHRLYWANLTGTHISFANLDGSGGENLNTAGAVVFLPAGVAIDPVGGRVYWANRTSVAGSPAISFASLDGSGQGGNLWIQSNGGVFQFPLLYRAPRPASAPAITGSSTPRSVLSCSTGAWAPDQTEALFYMAPQSFTYQWSRNGTGLPGATASTLQADRAGGDYRCQVTAHNAAGSAAQTTEAHHVEAAPSVGPLSLRLASARIRSGGPLPVAVVNGGDTRLSGSLSGRSKVLVNGRRKLVKLRAKAFAADGHKKIVLKLQLPKALRLELIRRHKLSIDLRATFAGEEGVPQVIAQKVAPRLLPPSE